MVEVLHDHFDAAQYKHIRSGQSNETIDNQTEEMEGASGHFAHTLRQFLQIAFGICAEIDVRDQESTNEEERVDAKCTVCDRLEDEFFFDHFSQFHIVRVFENDDACVAENDPSHWNGA